MSENGYGRMVNIDHNDVRKGLRVLRRGETILTDKATAKKIVEGERKVVVISNGDIPAACQALFCDRDYIVTDASTAAIMGENYYEYKDIYKMHEPYRHL